jgi:hypothetical protein
MAKLLSTPYPGDWDWHEGDDFNAYHEKTTKMLDAIEQKIYFPVGDGKAIYAVVSVSPPVLQWVPFGDKYQIDYAHIRGLRARDIQEVLDRDRYYRESALERRRS